MRFGGRIACAALLIALPVSAGAQTPRRPTFEERFAAADTARRGCLTYEQVVAARMVEVVRDFAAIDLARQGCLTLPEIKAFRQRVRTQRMRPPPPPQ